MSKSLSIILTVRNSEAKVKEHAIGLLKIAANLSNSVDMVIVDNGSTDDTEQMVMELCRDIPQINGIRASRSVPHSEAVRAGIQATKGQILLIQNVDSPISVEAIRSLWEMRDDEELVFARSESPHQQLRGPAMHSRPTWSGGTQMLRREAVVEVRESRQLNKAAVKIKRVIRTDLNQHPTAPAMFQHLSNIDFQQADR